MPLIAAPTGVRLRIVKVLADERTKKHLASLGLSVNAETEVVSRNGGNVVCSVYGGRLALDKDMATKILVA